VLSIRLLLLACVIIWGWTFVATKICLAYLNPIELIGARFLIGLPVLAGIVIWKKIPLRFNQRDWGLLSVGAAIITVHFLIQAFALKHTSATNTGWIIAVTPLVMAVLSFLILKERIGKREITGIGVATLGILLLISKGNLSNVGWIKSVGDWLILLSAHTWALYTIATRNVSRQYHPLAVTLIVFLPVTGICLAYLVVGSGVDKLVRLPGEPLVALLFLGVLGTAAQWFWQEGVARLGAARAGIFLYLEPVATTALAVPLLGETYGIATGLGGVLVLVGVWWAQRLKLSKPVV
jgi:drug/metabolite transporter (DMT)-like permease